MNHEEQADKMEQFDIWNGMSKLEKKNLVSIHSVLIKYLYGMSH